jgi:hypothetical protein
MNYKTKENKKRKTKHKQSVVALIILFDISTSDLPYQLNYSLVVAVLFLLYNSTLKNPCGSYSIMSETKTLGASQSSYCGSLSFLNSSYRFYSEKLCCILYFTWSMFFLQQNRL